MIGNICSIPTTEETQTIYVNSFDHFNGDQTIKIGKSLNEQIEVNLPISSFLRHILVFLEILVVASQIHFINCILSYLNNRSHC